MGDTEEHPGAPKPYEADGFEMMQLPSLSDLQIARGDDRRHIGVRSRSETISL